MISGGAGGLGRALSAQLQARGCQVVLVDRDVSALSETDSQRLIACDLTDPAQIDRSCGVIARDGPVDMVIHGAGLTHIGPFEGLSEAALRQLFEVNFFAAVALTRHLRDAVRAARGTHLALSSVAGFAPLYHRTGYAASKHALEGFFGSFRSEEAAHGVRVVIAAPSFVATNADHAGPGADGLTRPGSAGDGVDTMTADEAAAVILRGLDRGRDFIPVGRVARLSHLIHRLSPGVYRRLMESNIRGG